MRPTLSCFHCGEPVPVGTDFQVEIEGKKQPMCCIGCQSVAQAIVAAGAQAFYSQRTGPGLDAQRLEELSPWTDLLDDQDWTQRHVHQASAEHQLLETTLAIEGLRCGACAWLIEKTLGHTPGVRAARANASAERLFLRWDPTVAPLSAIAKRVLAIGYAVLPISSAPIEASRKQADRKALRRLFIAGLSAAQIMMYAYPEYMEGGGLEDDIRSLMRTASMLITLPVMAYSATPFFDSARRALAQGRLNMDVPVSLGLWIAFIASLWSWWTNSGEVYFDSVSMFVFLLLGSRWIEGRVRAKTSAQRQRLATALPSLAHRISPDPGSVAAWNLRCGDTIAVKSGERIPADGLLQSRETDVDASWLTGESLPVRVQQGERLTEGAINLGPEIEVLIDTKVAEGTLSRLSQLAEAAAADRPHWVAWADQIGARFTAALLIISAAVTAAFMYSGAPAAVWLPALIAILVVTCPCALSMAGPAAYAAALARLLEQGVAVANATTLERLLRVTDVVFDKTGTLTDPAGSSVKMMFGSTQDQQLAQQLAAASTHPLAKAIATMAPAAAQTAVMLSSITQHAGLGLSAQRGDTVIRLGSLSFTGQGQSAAIAENLCKACTVFLSINGIITAGFSITDQPRPEAATLLAQLRAQGKTIWCASGDREDRVQHLAHAIGIDANHALAEQTPDMKQAFVAQCQREGRIVAMIGDGHNDAPVLAQADVSLAMQGAAPLAQQKADVYCLRPGLSGVALAMQTAHRARLILRQNIIWAVAYNLVAIPFAAAGLITPLLASVGMAASSLLVVLNSSRLLR